jgi:UDP-N-acetylglucosamine 2-epimerase (non-hydrolysing)
MGLSRVVGTSRQVIVEEASELFSNRAAYRSMSEGGNPYGDGRAAERIVESLSRWFHGKQPLLESRQQFQGMARAEQVELNLITQ